MREPGILSRRAALPLAALFGPAAAAVVARPLADADAALLEIGRRWMAACAALHGNDVASVAIGGGERANRDLEAEGDRLFSEEQKLFDALMAMSPRTLKGLAMKARALARAHDILSSDRAVLEAAAASTWNMEASSALIVALDIIRLAERAA